MTVVDHLSYLSYPVEMSLSTLFQFKESEPYSEIFIHPSVYLLEIPKLNVFSQIHFYKIAEHL